MDNYAYQPDDNNGRPFVITRYSPGSGQNNHLVEVNSRSKFLKKNSTYMILSIILFIIALILLICLITVLLLDFSSEPDQICTTNECLRTAASLKNSIDFSVNPCDNFYKFACGKWSEEHPNHGWWRSFSSFTTISERVAIASQNALTNEDNHTTGEPHAIKKAKDFFKSCLDEDSLNELGLTSMYTYLKRVKLPIVPNVFTLTDDQKSTFSFNWMKTETLIKQNFMMDVFIGAVVDNNIFNGTENVIYVGRIFQSTPLPSPISSKKKAKFLEGSSAKIDVETYKTMEWEVNSEIIKYVVKEMMTNLSMEVPEESRLQDAADVILEIAEFVEQLSSNVTDDESPESGDDVYKISFKMLQSKTDKVLSSPQPNLWVTYFEYLFKGTNVTIDPEQDLLFVTDGDVEFIEKILPYVVESSPLDIELYMWWNTVYAMILSTSTSVADFIERKLDLFGNTANYVARSRSLECALLVNNYMGYAISYVLADQSFPNTTKPKVERMVTELKQSFIDHVRKIQWMDDITKKVTIEKSQEMITFIGYPNWLFEQGKLDEYYGDVDINATRYLDNMMSVIISQNLKKMNSLREKHERDWYSEPIEVNAFNSYSENAINVPMAILTYPMYHLGLEVLNYGSIGAILGHELTHGFDNMGRKHDKFGNHVQWWSNKTIENFENLTQCFVDQYENIPIDGVEETVRGKATLGENLADNGGLNQAFTAYKKFVEKVGREPKLPGFENYTNYQLFFIAYGNIWCQTISAEDIKDQLKYDEHCPNSVRVLGTLQNSEDFSSTFHCPKGSRMNPKDKCKIW